MTKDRVVVFVEHRAKPGQRDRLMAVWNRHMPAAIAANPDHLAYLYTADTSDQDNVRAVQVYRNADAATAFLSTDAYRRYAAESEPLLAHPPAVHRSELQWAKLGLDD